MRKQFLAFSLLLGKGCNANCSVLKAQWQKSRRAMINNNFSLSWLKLILQKTQLMIFPLHPVSEESVIPNAAYQYLFYSSPSGGSVLSAARQTIHYRLCWWLSHSVGRSLPHSSSEGRGGCWPCTTPEQSWPASSGAAVILKHVPKLSYSQTCPQSTPRSCPVLDRPWSCAIGGWTPNAHFSLSPACVPGPWRDFGLMY